MKAVVVRGGSRTPATFKVRKRLHPVKQSFILDATEIPNMPLG